MINHFFYPYVYIPLYNAMVFLIAMLPGHDVGLAIIVLTIGVKLVLYPLTRTATLNQLKMRDLQPKLDALKETYPDRETQSRKTLELYRAEKINPFGGLLPLLIQIPILISLFVIFSNSGLPKINKELLFGFVSAPDVVNTLFLGIFSLTAHGYVLPVIAGLTQFLLAQITAVAPQGGKPGTFAHDLGKSMQIQTLYVLPAIIAIIGFTLPTAVSLYYIVFNLISAFQEYRIRQKYAVRRDLKEQTV